MFRTVRSVGDFYRQRIVSGQFDRKCDFYFLFSFSCTCSSSLFDSVFCLFLWANSLFYCFACYMFFLLFIFFFILFYLFYQHQLLFHTSNKVIDLLLYDQLVMCFPHHDQQVRIYNATLGYSFMFTKIVRFFQVNFYWFKLFTLEYPLLTLLRLYILESMVIIRISFCSIISLLIIFCPF